MLKTKLMRQRQSSNLNDAATSERCYLLELPGELRNSIIELYLRQIYRGQWMPIASHIGTDLMSQHPALALTNRQLRSKTLSIFYGNNVFFLGYFDSPREYKTAQCWLTDFKHYLHHIKSVRVTLCDDHDIEFWLHASPGNPINFNITADMESDLDSCRVMRSREEMERRLQRLCERVGTGGFSVNEYLRMSKILMAGTPRGDCRDSIDGEADLERESETSSEYGSSNEW